MEKIASFTVDHLQLKPGVFVSRLDRFGDTVITTFDLRFKKPNKEPVIDMPALHTIEHLGATFLRADPIWGQRIIYFGPMGCRTGFYLILEGMLVSEDILSLLIAMLEWIQHFKGTIPGASAAECGNWREHNLDMARYEAERYAALLKAATFENLNYPAQQTV
ncbi:MAG: S-ribosylhomocysteine lyase [Spirochaetaceae bacterium]|jgi:S-ribosylhomocysteine lyase|nr:S-ribosylhomocysteine lyase [Spirochaetaceae bacterium]